MRTAIALTCADLLTFLGMLALLGPAAEANPIVRLALAGGAAGLAAVVVAKAALMVVLASWRAAVGRLERPVWLTGALVGLVGAPLQPPGGDRVSGSWIPCRWCGRQNRIERERCIECGRRL